MQFVAMAINFFPVEPGTNMWKRKDSEVIMVSYCGHTNVAKIKIT